MLPFSIGFGELVLIAVVILLVVGPARLPQIARTLACLFKMARKATRELQDAISAEELKEPLVRPWQEVVKARDDVVDSLMRDESAVQDAVMLDAECDGMGGSPRLEINPIETTVQASSAMGASEISTQPLETDVQSTSADQTTDEIKSEVVKPADSSDNGTKHG